MGTSPKEQSDLLFGALPPAPRVRRVGELLFEFVRGSDRAPMSCELRFNGESYGWEAQFFERGELFAAHGAFSTRGLAEAWARRERRLFEGLSDTDPSGESTSSSDSRISTGE